MGSRGRADDGNSYVAVGVASRESEALLDPKRKAGDAPAPTKQMPAMLFLALAAGSILSAIGFSALQEWVFKIPGFTYGGWMTFITYVTWCMCAALECAVTRGGWSRSGALRDYATVSMLAMAGSYLTNWALNYLNYTTRIVFKSCRVLPVMGFRTLVVGARYSASQYGAGAVLVAGIALFSMGDAEGMPNFSWVGIGLISLALVCDALTANLEERQFFRIRTPATHAEVMLYLSLFATVYSGVVLVVSGEVWGAVEHSLVHTATVPSICAFSVLGYATVCLILLIIKNFGATNAEIVKSMRKVFQVGVSFLLFPKALSYKYVIGGLLVTLALWWLQRAGKAQAAQEAGQEAPPAGGDATRDQQGTARKD